MLPSFNSCNLTLYIVFAWFLGICYGFVLISSAASGGHYGNSEVNLFRAGELLKYQLHSTILLNEKDESPKNVGFYIVGSVQVGVLWAVGDEAILRIEMTSPLLHIRSRKAPSPDGFIRHSSKLDDFKSNPFVLVWKSGRIDRILLADNEPLALANIKKGIGSLFQFQLLDLESNETDSSGHCSVIYQSLDPLQFQKVKGFCRNHDLPHLYNDDLILNTIVQSSRVINYELNEEKTRFKKISGRERHQIYLTVKEDLGNYIEADQILDFTEIGTCDQIQAENSDEAVLKLKERDNTIVYNDDTLITKKEEIVDEDSSVTNVINDLRNNLHEKHLGTLISAKAFLRLITSARKSSRDEISKALGSKKNKKILPQLYDVMGYVQTPEIHEIVMKKLHFDQEDHLELSERYLWALSMSSHPHSEIIEDLLQRHKKNENYPEKVKETLVLTLASMASTLTKSSPTPHNRKVGYLVEEAILNGLDYAKGDNRYVFLRALKNLQSMSTISPLLQIIKNGTNKEGVLAFRALKSLWPSAWSPQVLQTARRAFLQLDRKYDSSSRTLAVDILLESNPNPSDDLLNDLLRYLNTNDTNFEVKQYVFQRLKLIADQDPDLKARILEIIKSDPKLNNYSTLAPRGLSTALRRTFLRSPSSNGSLVTVQEMSSGIVKRGIINIVMDKNGKEKELVSLGIFSGGLGSFVSSNGNEGDDEAATAGMDLTILGTQIRPFIFFTGQGELMGHVWSGTASERTPAFQSAILLQDHLEFLRLGNGFIAELNLKGAMSFDLSGKIEISLWNRNAESLVEKSAGIIANGLIVVDTAFVRSQVEFTASLEPKLSLNSNIDFSSNTNLCMRVTQPDAIYRHNIFKIERIPGSKHKLRIAKYKKCLVPGTTYSLNRKNNEMCSAMFGR